MRQVISYAIIGLINTIIDITFFNLFFIFLSFPVSKTFSFIIAVCVSYILNSRYTFQLRRTYRRASKFLAVTTLSMFLNIFLAQLFYSLDMLPNLAVILAIIITAGINFISYKWYVFKKNA